MSKAKHPERSVIEWGWAGSALHPVEPSGDLHVVIASPEGALVAVVDGLGHGVEAATAAAAAARLLQSQADESVVALVQRCHEGLLKTRGVVMTLASFKTQDSSMTWVGVGNVEAVLLRADQSKNPLREAISLRGGVVGYQLPPLRASTLPVSPGDTVIMSTDGIRTGFTDCRALERSPQEIAESILAQHSKGSDDAHVVVARYLG